MARKTQLSGARIAGHHSRAFGEDWREQALSDVRPENVTVLTPDCDNCHGLMFLPGSTLDQVEENEDGNRP